MKNLSRERLSFISQEWLKEVEEKEKVFTQSYRPELDVTNGLINFKNNCYINSIIQCLASMKNLFRQLYDSFQNFETILKNPEFSLLRKFLQVLIDLQQEKKPVSLKNLSETPSVKNFKAFLEEFFQISNGQFVENTQNDAHEFFMWLIDFLEHSFRNVMDVIYHEVNGNSKHENVIKIFFSTKFNQRITCKYGHETIKCFNELCLSLDIENINFLMESITKFFEIERLNDQDGLYFCDQCETKVNAIKKIKINNAKDILILHLKRFKVNILEIGFFQLNYIIFV